MNVFTGDSFGGLKIFDYSNTIDDINDRINTRLTAYYDKTEIDTKLITKLDTATFDLSYDELDTKIDDISLNISTNYVSKNGDTMIGAYSITGNVYIDGSLNVLGDATYIQTQTVEISDNILLINSNQTGNPAPTLQSGIEVNRGAQPNYQFLFDESSDSFKIGEIGDLQKVATREDNPSSNHFTYWHNGEQRFKTDIRLRHRDNIVEYQDGDIGSNLTTLNSERQRITDVSNNLSTNYYTKTLTDTLLNGKSNVGHTHPISDIINLQTTLDGKVSLTGNENIGGIKTFTGVNATGSNIGDYIDYINFGGTGRRVHFTKDPTGDKFYIMTTGGGAPDPDQHLMLDRTGGHTRTNILGSVAIGKDTAPATTLDVSGNFRHSGYYNKGDVKYADIYAVGTGNNFPASTRTYLNGTLLYNSAARGLVLTIINNNLEFVSSTTYDTYGSDTERTNLATAMGNIGRNQIGILTSYDAWEGNNTSLKETAQRLGLTKLAFMTNTNPRRPYCAVFYGAQSGIQSREVIERMETSNANGNRATISCRISTDGTAVNIHGATSVNALYPSDSDANTNPAVMVNNNGNVGIRTTNPQNALHVFNNMSLESSSSSARLNLRGASRIFDIDMPDMSVNDCYMRLFRSTNTTGAKYIQLCKGDGSSQVDVQIASGTTNSYIRDGRLGIGTTSPSRKLHISGSGATYIRTTTTDGSGNSFLLGQDGDRVALWTNYNRLTDDGWGERLTIRNDNGRVGVNNNNPTATLSVTGTTHISGNTSIGNTSTTQGQLHIGGNRTYNTSTVYPLSVHQTNASGTSCINIYSAGTGFTPNLMVGYSNYLSTDNQVFEVNCRGSVFNRTGIYTTISDIRFKENITDASSQLDDMKRIRYVNYTLKGDDTQEKCLGVIAQELKEICPSLVDEKIMDDGSDVLTVKQSILFMKNCAVTKELIQKVEHLEEENQMLKERIERIENMLLRFENELNP